MPLDIYIQGRESRSVLSLEDGPLYWFLHPYLLSIKDDTGQYLDLYGNCAFSFSQLPVLRAMIGKIESSCANSPSSLSVSVGTKDGQAILKEINKTDLVNFLRAFKAVLNDAESMNAGLVCRGD